MKTCGMLVKTIDNLNLPCLRPLNHSGAPDSQHNPFSDSPPLVAEPVKTATAPSVSEVSK